MASINSITLLQGLGINLLNLANNHILDMGSSGLESTIQVCKDNCLNYFGAGKNLKDASTPYIYIDQKNRQKVAFLGFSEREFSAATDHLPGASPFDLVDSHYQIKKTAEENDHVIVIYHGGNEYYPLPSPYLKKKCKFLIDSGADTVICHHTHVVSGYEVYKEKPIFYGIGNLLFDLPGKNNIDWHIGIFVSLTINNDGINYEIIPFYQFWEDKSLSLLDSNEKKIYLSEMEKLSIIIKDDEKLKISWETFCENKAKQYLSFSLGFNRFERILLRFGIWPFWKIQKRNLTHLLNVIACDSHREAMELILWNQLKQ